VESAALTRGADVPSDEGFCRFLQSRVLQKLGGITDDTLGDVTSGTVTPTFDASVIDTLVNPRTFTNILDNTKNTS